MIRRRLFNFASIVSLLLCVAAIALGCADGFVWEWPEQKQPVIADSRSIVIVGGWETGYIGLFRQRRVHHKPPLRRNLLPSQFEMIGVRAEEHGGGEGWIGGAFDGELFTHYLLSARLVTGLTALLPALRIIAFVRPKRTLRAACATCNYNLTGNTSGTCTECGTPVPSKPGVIA